MQIVGVKVLKAEPVVRTLRYSGDAWINVSDLMDALRLLEVTEPYHAIPVRTKEIIEQTAKISWPKEEEPG